MKTRPWCRPSLTKSSRVLLIQCYQRSKKLIKSQRCNATKWPEGNHFQAIQHEQANAKQYWCPKKKKGVGYFKYSYQGKYSTTWWWDEAELPEIPPSILKISREHWHWRLLPRCRHLHYVNDCTCFSLLNDGTVGFVCLFFFSLGWKIAV